MLASDPVAYVRANAVLGLAWAGARTPELYVNRLHNDRSPWVRINALRALRHLRVKSIKERHRTRTLKAVTKELAGQDPDPRVRAIARRLLTPSASRTGGSWIGLYLVDQSRQPFRDRVFSLITSSGLVKAAYSDGMAEAWEEGLQDGHCFTELPTGDLSSSPSKN